MGSKLYAALMDNIRAHTPGERREADLPLTISQRRAEALLHVVHDLGGQPDGPIDKTPHKIAPWEQRTHATCECLAWRGVWVSEERRRRENDLGEVLYFATPYYEGRREAFYMVRFNQTELWPDYGGAPADILETEFSERWLEPAGDQGAGGERS
jgi:hypothetical protein